ncbi:MAG: hypothetical protein IPP57_16035 [Candidatus Obscuribacter sp.]|nr:hypothetical protein [Candidatus Obscuribacter sp.]
MVIDRLTAAAKVVPTVTVLSVVVIDQLTAATAPKVKADRLVSVLPDQAAIDQLMALINQPPVANQHMEIDLLTAREPLAVTDPDMANRLLQKPKQAVVVAATVPSTVVQNQLKSVVLTNH